jgi:hypothetical protein
MEHSYYSIDTGLFTGLVVDAPMTVVAGGAPPGCAWVVGRVDHLTNRMDLAALKIVPYAPPAAPVVVVAGRVRNERDARLRDTDWRVTRALEMGQALPDPWKAYRTALRELPLQPGFPQNVAWPEPPG